MFKEELKNYLKSRIDVVIEKTFEEFPNWRYSDGTIKQLEETIENFESDIYDALNHDV